MLRAKTFGTLNDGVAVIYKPTAARAMKSLDPSTTYGLATVAGLSFESKSNRQQDAELADAEGFTLTRKVRVRNMSGINTGMLALIGQTLHEIGYTDTSGNDLYLYLDAIETDGTVVLQKVTTEIDESGDKVETVEPTTAWCRKRSWAQSRTTSTSDALSPSLTCTVRREDWDGQQRIEKDGRTYTVTAVKSRGSWVELTATQKAGDR